MSLSLFPGPFFGLEAEQLQHLLGCSPTIGEPAKETPGSIEMSGNEDGERKVVRVIPGVAVHLHVEPCGS